MIGRALRADLGSARGLGVAGQNLSADDDDDHETLAKRLSQAFEGPTVMQKGGSDIISDGTTSLKNDTRGGLRRCGGQGDLLSGSTGVFLAWGAKWEQSKGSVLSTGPKSSRCCKVGGC